MLIREAELLDGRIVDLRIAEGHIAELAPSLPHRADEPLIEAQGGLLLPGLHDHHLHLYSLAAALDSVPCGPPQVRDREQLRAQLQAGARALAPGEWLRGTGYHESVAGELDRAALDALLPDRPLRIQQRSGRLWLLNSAALAQLEAANGDDPLERVDGRATGRLYDADDWLRTRLPRRPRSLARASRLLASQGVTGVTDTTPHNDLAAAADGFAAAQASGELRQRLMLMGDASLDALVDTPQLLRGAHKFHLHDHELPDFDALCADIRRAHAAGRGAAFHCVSRTDLVYALQALCEAGVRAGDRIEHASVLPPELLEQVRALRLTVVTQPHFIAERGDEYLSEVAAEDQPWLYRLRSLLDAGIPLAGGSDAPFGAPDPWAAMQAAVTRRTRGGQFVAAEEALSPEQALALFTGAAAQPGGAPRMIERGAVADLCLLEQAWRALRPDLAAARVRWVVRDGEPIYS
ncbi:MAG: amidohydrolase family protein [Stagnimonas sp.]|nr:amidohydrolase family protein [Stagnimonas sp.]